MPMNSNDDERVRLEYWEAELGVLDIQICVLVSNEVKIDRRNIGGGN